jgi:hypothetical protein
MFWWFGGLVFGSMRWSVVGGRLTIIDGGLYYWSANFRDFSNLSLGTILSAN